MVKNKIVNVESTKKPKRDVSNLLIITFLIVFFVFGFDFGFSKILKKNIQFLASCFCYFLSVVIITAISIEIIHKIGNGQITASSWLIYGLIQYSFHVIFLRFSKYNFYNLIVDMHSVDTTTKDNSNKGKLFVNFMMAQYWLNMPVLIIFCYFFCTNKADECETLYLPAHIFCVLIMLMCIITITEILIYYYIYEAAKFLKVSLEDKSKDVKWAREQFTAVADISDNIAPTYGRLVSSQLVVTFFSSLVYICDTTLA